MAIQPIDLQTLFTQADKAIRSHGTQGDGLSVQQAMHGVQIERKTGEQSQIVQEAQKQGEGVEKTKDRKRGQNSESNSEQEQNENEETEEASVQQDNSVIRDPSLGHNIDISL